MGSDVATAWQVAPVAPGRPGVRSPLPTGAGALALSKIRTRPSPARQPWRSRSSPYILCNW